MFRRLYEFSREHPQYFALMFVDRTVPRISRGVRAVRVRREMKQHLIAQVQHCIDAGGLPRLVTPTVAFRLLTHGR